MSTSRIALRRSQAGLNIVELMVAMAIGLFLLIGLVSVFATANRTQLELSRSVRQIENGRYAIQILSDDLALAGFYGRYPANLPVPGVLPDPCVTSDMAALRAAAALHIQGYDAPASPPAPLSTCLAAANHVPGTDIVVLRRTDSQAIAPATGPFVANEVYMQTTANASNPANPIVALGNAANFTLKNKDTVTFAPARKYRTHVYFIAPCSVPAGGGSTCTGANDDGGAPIPTLKRLELAVDPADNVLKMRVIPLVEGIENLQIDYGLDAATPLDGTPDGAYVTAPAGVADWPNVVAVRVNLLARNTEVSPGFVDDKTYDLGAAGTVAPGGPYKRHVYNAVVRLVNPSGRRETP